MSTEEMKAVPGPVVHGPVTRVARVLGLAFSTGMLALFISRDLIQASSTVYTLALALGALAGVALELAAESVRLNG